MTEQLLAKYCEFFGVAPPVPGALLPTFTRTVQTCRAVPSQWNAWDADGQYHYLRYRSGRGTIETAASEEDYIENGPTKLIAWFLVDDARFVGEMSLEEFLRHAGGGGDDG